MITPHAEGKKALEAELVALSKKKRLNKHDKLRVIQCTWELERNTLSGELENYDG